VVFYDQEGHQSQQFDYSGDESAKEFAVAQYNPTGDTVVVGAFDRFYIYSFSLSRQSWEESGVKTVENLYTVTALGWKPDGSRLAVGSLCGGTDVYDACVRRHLYKGKFEFTYVSTSVAIVKRLQVNTPDSLSAELIERYSDGAEDQGAKERSVVGAKERIVTSVFKSVSRASGSPFCAKP
jgi:intraflagellar transport protein 172